MKEIRKISNTNKYIEKEDLNMLEQGFKFITLATLQELFDQYIPNTEMTDISMGKVVCTKDTINNIYAEHRVAGACVYMPIRYYEIMYMLWCVYFIHHVKEDLTAIEEKLSSGKSLCRIFPFEYSKMKYWRQPNNKLGVQSERLSKSVLLSLLKKIYSFGIKLKSYYPELYAKMEELVDKYPWGDSLFKTDLHLVPNICLEYKQLYPKIDGSPDLWQKFRLGFIVTFPLNFSLKTNNGVNWFTKEEQSRLLDIKHFLISTQALINSPELLPFIKENKTIFQVMAEILVNDNPSLKEHMPRNCIDISGIPDPITPGRLEYLLESTYEIANTKYIDSVLEGRRIYLGNNVKDSEVNFLKEWEYEIGRICGLDQNAGDVKPAGEAQPSVASENPYIDAMGKYKQLIMPSQFGYTITKEDGTPLNEEELISYLTLEGIYPNPDFKTSLKDMSMTASNYATILTFSYIKDVVHVSSAGARMSMKEERSRGDFLVDFLEHMLKNGICKFSGFEKFDELLVLKINNEVGIEPQTNSYVKSIRDANPEVRFEVGRYEDGSEEEFGENDTNCSNSDNRPIPTTLLHRLCMQPSMQLMFDELRPIVGDYLLNNIVNKEEKQ